jgi:hypothetical protein
MDNQIDEYAEAWDRATAPQLLQWAKLLGATHQAIADHLGVSYAVVGMWISGHRPIPSKYRRGLLAYAPLVYRRAWEQHERDAKDLPTPALQASAAEAFHAPLDHWTMQTLFESGAIKTTMLTIAQRLIDLLTQPHLAHAETDTLLHEWMMFNYLMRVFLEMAGASVPRLPYAYVDDLGKARVVGEDADTEA